MSFYGKWETWKIVYVLANMSSNATHGVAFVEAGDQGHAMQVFREQYRGQYSTVESCKKLLG
jgi:acyl-homoserine lactone acylase PvdQ